MSNLVATTALDGMKILVVEDSMLLADQMEYLLEHLGCEVIGPVGHLEDGLAAAEHEQFDLALLDINLGYDITCYPIVEVLDRRGIPLVFTTGYGERSIAEEYRDRPRITKPYRERDLTAAILAARKPQ